MPQEDDMPMTDDVPEVPRASEEVSEEAGGVERVRSEDRPRGEDQGPGEDQAHALLARLEALGIDATTVSHRPVYTVEEAKTHRGRLPGAHTKNLFLRDRRGPMWLVVVLESRPVDLAELAAKLGQKRFSFCSERRLREHLGVIPGAVTPFAVVNDHEGSVRVALDASLREHELWNFHPLVNSMTTTIRGEDMLRFLRGVDHPPTWVDFG